MKSNSKEIHNLSKTVDNLQDTVKNLKAENAELKTGKTGLKLKLKVWKRKFSRRLKVEQLKAKQMRMC